MDVRAHQDVLQVAPIGVWASSSELPVLGAQTEGGLGQASPLFGPGQGDWGHSPRLDAVESDAVVVVPGKAS